MRGGADHENENADADADGVDAGEWAAVWGGGAEKAKETSLRMWRGRRWGA